MPIVDKHVDPKGGLSHKNVRWNPLAKTASYTITEDDFGRTLTTRGATGAVTFTLPTPTQDDDGAHIRIFNAVDQNMVVDCATSGSIIALDNDAADSVTFSTTSQKIGACADIVCDGTSWLFLHYRGTAVVA